MTASLLTRALPLLVTTMLATPVLAQSASPSTPASSSPSIPQSTQGSQMAPAPSSMATQSSTSPSGTAQKAMPMHNSQASVARKPGESMQNLVERRIADLHSKLHITQAQSSQWDQFAQMMRDNARDIDQGYQQRAEKLSSMSAVDNMQSYASIEQTRAQDVQKLVPAFQSLYASLSDQQKRTADDLFRNYAASAQKNQSAAR